MTLTSYIEYISITDPSNVKGAIVVTNEPRLILMYADEVLVNASLPAIQVPVETALHGFASMAVIDGTVYIGGLDGIVYEIKVNASVSIPEDKITASEVSLDKFCHVETFLIDENDPTAVCFSNDESTLEAIKVHPPSELGKYRFKNVDYISNCVNVDADKERDNVYYVHNNSLYKANINEMHTLVETFETCMNPLLLHNKGHYIILQCDGSTSEVYVPAEYGPKKTPGIQNGAWKYSNQVLYPCHGTGFDTLVYSRDEDTIIFYNIYGNDNYPVFLKGAPKYITCVLNDSNLILIVKDESCSCWMEYRLNGSFHYIASFPIPHSDGNLTPFVKNNQTLHQKVLVFQGWQGHVQSILIPSAHQVLHNIADNTSHSITNDIVLFHGLISVEAISIISKNQTTHSTGEKDQHKSYVGIPAAAVLTVLVVTGVIVMRVKCKRRNREQEQGFNCLHYLEDKWTFWCKGIRVGREVQDTNTVATQSVTSY